MSCGCGKPKPCPDGTCPHKRREPGTRLMPFSLWVTNYAPVVPKFYWDVESQEQRIYHLSLELDRLRAYINYIFCEVEKLANELAEALDRAEALLDELAAKIREVEQLISELRQVIADINARMDAVEAEFARVKQQAQRAEQTANEAKTAAQQANTKADAAQTAAQQAQQQAQQANTKADAAQTAAQQAQQQAQQTKTDLTALTARVAALEECCEDARRRLTVLENFKAAQERTNAQVRTELDALNVATTEDPQISMSNLESSGQISSGPIPPATQGIYASTLAIDVPCNVAANTVRLNSFACTARIGGYIAFEMEDGTKKVISALYLIENGQASFPEIIGWYCVPSRGGLRIRIQFDKPLWRVGTNPEGQWIEEKIMNATPFAPAVWLDAVVTS